MPMTTVVDIVNALISQRRRPCPLLVSLTPYQNKHVRMVLFSRA